MKKYLTADDIANNVRMIRTQQKGTILITEGSTDMRLYQRFVNTDKCTIIPANGKDNAIKVIRILEKFNFKGIFTIVDLDFWKLDGIEQRGDNILTTDTHDIETMLISSKALDNLLVEFGEEHKIRALNIPVRDLLYEVTLPLGIFRWISSSSKERLSLRFKDIVFENFIQFRPFSINLSRLIREVKTNSRNMNISEKRLKREIISLMKKGPEPEQVCSGHDVVAILTIGLNHVFGNRTSEDVSEAVVDRVLRLSYDITIFRETKLYASIQEWEQNNPPFTVLQNEA